MMASLNGVLLYFIRTNFGIDQSLYVSSLNVISGHVFRLREIPRCDGLCDRELTSPASLCSLRNRHRRPIGRAGSRNNLDGSGTCSVLTFGKSHCSYGVYGFLQDTLSDFFELFTTLVTILYKWAIA